MSKRSVVLRLLVPFLVLAGSSWTFAASSEGTGRWATYQAGSGERFFALSLKPDLSAPQAAACDTIVLFDTSASQVGLYRDDALTALESLASSLAPQDRMRIFAVDLRATPMDRGFQGGEHQSAAIEQLKQRTPLGATDLPAVLQAAAQAFSSDVARARALVYIGDGLSSANFITTDEFRSLVDVLVSRRIAVTSFAIGPQRNVPSLCALANQTGGMIFVDQEDSDPRLAGGLLARAARTTVIWPVEVSLPPSLTNVYPSTLPPLRGDRDSVVIGKMDDSSNAITFTVLGESSDGAVRLSWTLAPEASSAEFAFLPRLTQMAAENGGLLLPTVGSAGLLEASRVLSGKSAAETQDKVGQLPPDDQAVYYISYQQPPTDDEPALRLGSDNPAENLLEDYGDNLLDTEEARKAREEQRLKALVEDELRQSREQMRSQPADAVRRLKMLLEDVERSTDAAPEARTELRRRIQFALQDASRMQIEAEQRQSLAEENRAIQMDRLRLLDEMERQEQTISSLMDRFNMLLDEGRYDSRRYLDADLKVAAEIQRINPRSVAAEAAVWQARFIRQFRGLERFRALRHKNFADALYTVEEALVPFNDEPPVLYPSAEFWEDISRKREKYKSINLASDNKRERRIYEALDDDTIMEFVDTPLSDVVETLKDFHDIPIVMDTRALEDLGVDTSTPVNINLKNLSLRSGLRILLNQLDLDYIIKDEVLKITTPDVAQEELVTRVYPVGDLVLPIISGMGGMGGGMMGGMGGGMMGGMGGMGGGMMGGMGGMGGGMGMGGMGGGMGGGMFCVEDDLKLIGDKNVSTTTGDQADDATSPATHRPQSIRPGELTWDAYFQTHEAQPADVRQTVRELMQAKNFSETAVVIQAAIRSGQVQPWMYEALGLALTASKAPIDQIERALMSTVDFSANVEEVLHAATYMASMGLKGRALDIFRQVAEAQPTRPEPYLQGLALAQKLKDLEGVQWACVGVLSQAWPSEQMHLAEKVYRTAEATYYDLRKEGKVAESDAFEARIREALRRDCVIRVTWTGEADIDMLVQEPTGSVCSVQQPHSVGGGILMGDTFAGSAKADADGYSETYVLPRGFTGKYKLALRKIWGDVSAGKVTVDVVTHYGSDDQRVIHQQIDLGQKDALVLFELKNGRRQELVEENALETIVRDPELVGRAILAQQLAADSPTSPTSPDDNSDALRRFEFWRRQFGNRFPAFFGGRGAVGFRPEITTLPEGTSMRVTTAIASADRRYVRVSPQPLFSGIGEVSTFNFVDGETGTSGTGGTGGAGGIGGGAGFGGGGGIL